MSRMHRELRALMDLADELHERIGALIMAMEDESDRQVEMPLHWPGLHAVGGGGHVVRRLEDLGVRVDWDAGQASIPGEHGGTLAVWQQGDLYRVHLEDVQCVYPQFVDALYRLAEEIEARQ